MFDFHEKRKIRSFLYSKTVFVLLLILIILLSISAYNRFKVAQDTKKRLEERRDDLEALETRAEILDSKVEYLEDARGIEEELRNRFDVAKEGEQVIIIIDDDRQNAKDDSSSFDAEKPKEVEKSTESIFKLFKFW